MVNTTTTTTGGGPSEAPGSKVNLLVPNPDFCFWWTPGLWTERRFRTAEGQRLHFRQIVPTVAPVEGLKRIHLVGAFDDSVLPGPRGWDDRYTVGRLRGIAPEEVAFHSFVITDEQDVILVALTTTLDGGRPYFEALYVLEENLRQAAGNDKRYWDGGLWDFWQMWTEPPPEEPYDASIWLFEQCRTEHELRALEAERILLEIAG